MSACHLHSFTYLLLLRREVRTMPNAYTYTYSSLAGEMPMVDDAT